MPPTPKARSNESAPVGRLATARWVASPRRITAPSPNCFLMRFTAACRAWERSSDIDLEGEDERSRQSNRNGGNPQAIGPDGCREGLWRLPTAGNLEGVGAPAKRKPAESSLRRHHASPPCRVLPGFEPACAGGILPTGFALAEAYRVPRLSQDPISMVLAQNDVPHHGHSRV